MTQRTYQFGITSVEIHSKAFIDGINAGMQCYFDSQEDTLEVSGEEFVAQVMGNMRAFRDPQDRSKMISKEWLVGFVFGKIAGMLHPDLSLHSPGDTERIEALSQRCQHLYNNFIENEIA